MSYGILGLLMLEKYDIEKREVRDLCPNEDTGRYDRPLRKFDWAPDRALIKSQAD